VDSSATASGAAANNTYITFTTSRSNSSLSERQNRGQAPLEPAGHSNPATSPGQSTDAIAKEMQKWQLTAKLQECTSQNERLTGKNERLKMRLRDRENENQRLKENIIRSENKLKEFENKLKDSENKLKEFEGKLKESEGKLIESEGKAKESKVKLEASRADNEELKKELKDCEERLRVYEYRTLTDFHRIWSRSGSPGKLCSKILIAGHCLI
jgi:DNA repair exonuclease SbcCD ATPase subunit